MENFEPINVDFLINSGKVKADSEAVRRELIKTDNTTEQSAKHVSEVVTRAYSQSIKEVAGFDQAVKASTASLAAQTAQVARMKPQFNGLANSINQLTREAPAFAVSAQVGILALSNNIPILADEIKKLKVQNDALIASGQKGVPIWKSITGALFGWQTMLSLGITLLTLYGREVGEFVKRMFSAGDSIDRVKMRQDALNASLNSNDYQKGLSNVLQLKNNFELAKDGMISADVVLKQYNDTLGKVIGQADNLNDAEKLFVNNTDNYINALLAREAAQIVANDTAKKMVEFKQREVELEKEYAAEVESQRELLQRLNSGFGGPNDDVQRQAAQVRVANANKALNDLRRSRQQYLDEQNRIFKDFSKQLFDTGLNLDGNDDDSKAIVNARQSLLDQLTALDREYARKKLKDDEEEIQALKDKFTRVRELVERFNKANPAAAIAMGDINAIEDRSLANLRQAQSDKRLEKEQAEAEKKRKQQEKEWAELLKGLRNYEKQRADLIAEYQEKREALIQAGKTAELAVLEEQHKKEIEDLDDAQIRKLEVFRKLYDETVRVSREATKKLVENAKKLLENELISAELREKILLRIQELENDLANDQFENIKKWTNQIAQLGNQLSQFGGELGQIGDFLNGVSQNVASLEKIFDPQASKGDIITAGINGLINLIGMVASAAAERKRAEEAYYRSMIQLQHEYNVSINEQLRLQSELDENVFLVDYVGKMTDGMLAATEASMKLNDEIKKLADAEVKVGQRNKIDWGNVGKGAGAGAAVGAAVGSIVPVIGTAIGAAVGAGVGALTGLFAGTKKGNVWGSLLGEYPELIEQTENGMERINVALAQTLINQGLVNKETAQTLQNIIDWQNALDEAKQQLDSVIITLVGQVGNDLRDALVNAFEEGTDAGKAMTDTISGYLENVLAQKIFFTVFNPLFDQLQNALSSDTSLSWTDEFQNFIGQFSELIPMFNQALADAQKAAQDAGLDIFKPDGDKSSGGGLKSGVQRLTEETASELTGLYRATYDLMARSFGIAQQQITLDQQCLDATMNIMQTNALIEQNTAEAARQLEKVLTELRDINDNTRTKSSGDDYDKGFSG